MALYGLNKYSHGMTAEVTCKARHLVQNTHTSVPNFIGCIILTLMH